MAARIYDFIRTLVSHFLLSRNSRLKGKSRLYLFNRLTLLYFKSLLYPRKDRIVTDKIFDYRVSAYSHGELHYLFKEIFLLHSYNFNAQTDAPKIVDCGANIGMSILYFKTLYPNCSIIAFEPNPFVFELLKKNIDQNNLRNVRIENTALSNKNGDTEFFLSDNKGSLVGSLIQERGGKNSLKITTSKLSDYVGNQSFDFIKMDIEGAENQVLEDLIDTGKVSSFREYVVEYHHNIQNMKSKLANFLLAFENNGFQYSLSTSFEKVGEVQDILIRFFK